MARYPSISETAVGLSLIIEFINDCSSSFIAFTGAVSGLITAIVFVPFGVSRSNEKALASPGCFNLMISVFFEEIYSYIRVF